MFITTPSPQPGLVGTCVPVALIIVADFLYNSMSLLSGEYTLISQGVRASVAVPSGKGARSYVEGLPLHKRRDH